MKITKKEGLLVCTFDELKAAEVFIQSLDANYYMKTTDGKCVNLDTGSINNIIGHTKVWKLQAELVVGVGELMEIE